MIELKDMAMSLSPQKPPTDIVQASSASGPEAASIPVKRRIAPIAVGGIGTVLVLTVAGSIALTNDLFTETATSATPLVKSVAQRDLDAASLTLTPSVAGALIDDAKRCKSPLASITISKGTAEVGKMLRIRAGSYVSPYFAVTETPGRIALPYPAPYGKGAGDYVVEGNATGAMVSLAPAKVLVDLPSPQTISVWWHTADPC